MNRAKFQKTLGSLVGWRERAFIAALAERAAPNIELYFESIGHSAFASEGDSNGLKGVMDQIWQFLISQPNEEKIIELLDVVVQCLPEEADEDHFGIIPARDFVALIEMALLGGINDEKRRAAEASQRSLETVIQFIEFTEGEGLSENKLVKLLDQHPLVEREFSFQQEMSDFLRSASNPSNDVISELRNIAFDEGVSNIGIALD